MTEKTSKPRSRLFIVLALAALLVLATGLGAWFYFSGSESTDDAQVDGHIHPVNAKIGGTVEQVNVKENQRVDAGTILVQIDTRDYQVSMSRAHADLADAQAQYEAARAGLPVKPGKLGRL